MKCPICGEPIKPGRSRLWAAVEHFKPISIMQWPFLIGTFRQFGWDAALSLMSPAYTTIRYWKYRRCQLTSIGPDNVVTYENAKP